jgi:signal transduction histidine kinase/CheY-like chemotaxis protein/HPt (histidine-containing phosphotransfer) domain-containing protein
MRLDARERRIIWTITLAFLLLELAAVGLLTAYWSNSLAPRLYQEAAANAKILADSQSHVLAASLDGEAPVTPAAVTAVVDKLLLYTDPQVGTPFFRGLRLEVDYGAVRAMPGSLDFARGSFDCPGCFVTSVELFSPRSDELLGIATIAISDDFFRKLYNDVRQKLLVEGILLSVLIVLAWAVSLWLLRRFQAEQQKAAMALESARAEADAANAAKSEFLANMSHEIRTPMSAIIGLSHLVLRSRLPTHQHDLVQKIRDSAQELLRLLNDILDFSRVEAGMLSIESIPFELDEVLDKLANLVGARAGEKGLDILYAVERGLPLRYQGDPYRLGQVLLNLVNNAIKFTEKGEILIRVEQLRADSDGHVLQFSVRDSGIGIAPEYLARLFSSFSQADSSMGRRYGGSGLGLAISRQLVRLMGGDIHVESEPGRGSCFSFTIRLQALADAAGAKADIGRDRHVLLVDDSEVARATYADMLQALGYHVLTAAGGEEALAMVRDHADPGRISAVVVDWKIPDMDGVDIARRLRDFFRDGGRWPMPRIVLISAHAFDGHAQDEGHGIDAYLNKPFSLSSLHDALLLEEKAAMATPALPDTVRFRDVKLLLVEDNAINQMVACNLLRDFGCEVVVADNGREALRLVREQAVDAILMDVQMPELDGYETTARLRADGVALPIIAMTAHALRGDRERCLGAGMNDYVTKPIDVEQLLAALKRALPGRFEAVAADVLAPVGESAAALDLDEASADQRFRGNLALWKRLLAQFLARSGDLADRLEQLPANSEAMAALLHQLKGEAGNLSAQRVYEFARSAEQSCRAGAHVDSGMLRQLLADLQAALQLLPEPAAAAGAAPAAEVVLPPAELIERLLGFLGGNNLQARRLARDILPLWKQRHAASAAEFESAVQNLQFLQALALLRRHAQSLQEE